jgi:carboxyl-terminal processing protease
MKKTALLLLFILVAPLGFISCEDEDDNAVPVNDFIWKGLNLYYLWQADVPNLADDRFASQADLNNFLEAYSSPEDLFESLLYQRGVIDRFSVIFSDFTLLENALQGVVKSNGVEFGLLYADASETNIIGYVRYILPGSDASTKNIQRGDIFYAVNGNVLTANNYQSLLGADSYTLNLADFDGTTITPNGEEVTLTKAQYAENPVYTTNVITQGSHNIGYLMYNGFYSNYNAELNAAFAQLDGAGVTDLVLDLRYNGGGSVQTATYLASMITGQFNGQLFARQQWNSKLQAFYEGENPGALQNLFTDNINGAGINSLNLSKVYILTSHSTASASELVINCLKPYIEVVVIGDTTTGKNVGSVTLYDSKNFGRSGASGSHKYAMQPIVLKTINAAGFGDYSAGIAPDVQQDEDYSNLGVLGDVNEPLFATAISLITANGRHGNFAPDRTFRKVKSSKEMRRFGTEMYIENMPEGSLNLMKDLQ